MEMVYNSQRYCVVQFIGTSPPVPIGVEIMDKALRRECYIGGSDAETFFRTIEKLVEKSATPEEIDEILDGYSDLFTQPITLQ